MRIISIIAAVAVACTLGARSAEAASVSYYLDQSNALPDGTNYLKVTVADDGQAAPSTVYFTVEILAPLSSLAGPNFGIQRFAFNSSIDPLSLRPRIGNLPDGWKISLNDNVSGFGVFELVPTGNGRNRQSPTLTFSIDSSAFPGDSIYDYIQYASCPSGGSPNDPYPITCIPAQGPAFFAAHVAGFSYAGGISSAYFGGDRLVPVFGPQTVPPAVPIPAAIWMFAGALAVLGSLRRHCKI